jgi:hypothetical protein
MEAVYGEDKSPKKRVGRGVWLYSYDYIRTRTRLIWIASFTLGLITSASAVAFLWGVAHEFREEQNVDFGAIAIAAMLAGIGVLEVPAGLIYFWRRWRGEPVDIWQTETPNDPAVRDEME